MRDIAGYPPASWNDTARRFRSDAVVTDLISAAVAAHAGRPAVVAADTVLYSYAELHADATRLARLLRELGAGPGGYVAVLGSRSPDTVIALLAVALAGAAFVPIGLEWPVSRRAYVLSATGARWLIGAGLDLTEHEETLRLAPGVRDVIMPDVAGPRPRDPRRDPIRQVWDSVVRSPKMAHAAGFNLGGSRQFTDEEVGAYARHVAGLVLAESPSTVLEVGFGSGLVLRQVAPHVDLYCGVEPSPYAVRASQEWAKQHGCWLDLVPGFADDIEHTGFAGIDVALLASVAQYFPSLGYLAGVLAQLGAVVRPGGAVVLADLIPAANADGQDELTVDRAFFDTLATSGVWEAAERRPRDQTGGFPPGLAGRYDVVLRRSGRPAAADRPRIWTGWHLAQRPAEPLAAGTTPADVAYVIFTSGSTGQPKGVAVGHRSLVNLIEWVNSRYAVGPGDRLLQVSSFCFDLSVYDVFGILSSGGAIRVASEDELREPSLLAGVLIREPVTFWNSAPAMLSWVLPYLSARRGGQADLRLVFLSGDWIPVQMPGEIGTVFPAATVVSLGGATEATVWSNDYVVTSVDPAWQSIPYGRPMQNARYYVLDDHLRPAPVDVPGDLYIAGACLALGYHGDPRLTGHRFLPDPFAAGERMYATGDRARWRPDGNLQFLGRVDHQVKIRGYRVELGEVESAMAAHGLVRAVAVVAARHADDRVLAGFYTCRPPGIDPDLLRTVLAATLPSYMVPSVIRRLTELPLTANGKVDRGALSARAETVLSGAAAGPDGSR